MVEFNEWLFQINVPDVEDAHHALVKWLRRNELGELFTEQHKSITYVVFKDEQNYSLVVKSCVPIRLPEVVHHQFDVDFSLKVKVVVQLSVKKRIRPPNLLHEEQSSLRHNTTIREMTASEKSKRVINIINELGFDAEQSDFEISEGISIPILHKRQKLLLMEPTMNVIIDGKVSDVEKFKKAWSHGVGNKRVYGLGCVRIIQCP